MLLPNTIGYRFLLGTFVFLGMSIAHVSQVQAQSGLPSRPINLTCVAPAAATQSFELEQAVLSASSRAEAGQGHAAGILYRGQLVPALHGHYVYISDGALQVESRFNHSGESVTMPLTLPRGSALAEGVDSELYIVDGSGKANVVRQATAQGGNPPATLLSQTGCFDSANPSVPAEGLIEYSPNAPLWSDDATKRRWIAMPDWQTPGSQITVLPNGDFDFPDGTVLIKEFALGETLVETRLIVRDLSGNWAGYTYEWNEQQTDATLLESGKVSVVNGQEWEFPSPFECLYCHSVAANRSLGLEAAQLNNSIEYTESGILANQLTTLVSIGLIDASIGEVNQLDSLPAYDDEKAAIDLRARGYLHSNCSNCHRPGGPGQGPVDFRYQLAGEDIGANDVVPWLGDTGVEGAKLLVRGQPELSVLALRMKYTNFFRMPPVGSLLVDAQGTALVDRWIESGLGFGIGDADGDVKADDLDNCSAVANASQLDADGDGYGNICDPDLNNDGIVNFLDLALFRPAFLTTDPVVDFNGDGIVNFLDLSIFAGLFLQPPGPSGLNSAAHTASRQ